MTGGRPSLQPNACERPHEPCTAVGYEAKDVLLSLLSRPNPTVHIMKTITYVACVSMMVACGWTRLCAGDDFADARRAQRAREREWRKLQKTLRQQEYERKTYLKVFEAAQRARAYEFGLTTTDACAQAVEYYRKAAELGDTASMVDLGIFYALGLGVRADDDAAARWFCAAAAKADERGMLLASLFHFAGRTSRCSDAQAAQWCQAAANRDNPLALATLGLLYLRGRGLSPSFTNAVSCYRAAEARGSREAMFALAVLYDDGRYLPRDWALAREYYARALLGIDLPRSSRPVPVRMMRSEFVARLWYHAAARLGEHKALWRLGTMYECGDGVARDQRQAAQWYHKAATLGEPYSMLGLGRLYAAASNRHAAARWYHAAAQRGASQGMLLTGLMQFHAPPPLLATPSAVRWWYTAASNGDAQAMAYLALMYAHGVVVSQNARAAVMWYNKAAAGGAIEGMTGLSLMFATGRGVTQDVAQASAWWQRAERARFDPRSSACVRVQLLCDPAAWYALAESLGEITTVPNIVWPFHCPLGRPVHIGAAAY